MTARRRGPALSPRQGSKFHRAATSPTAKAIYVGVAAVGLTALAIAIFGPRRFQQVVVRPVGTAITDQSERLWAEAQPLRRQLTRLVARATDEGTRDKLVRSFQSWIGHFRAR